MNTLVKAGTVGLLTSVLAGSVTLSKADQLQSPAAQLVPNYTYQIHYQNPGAPDQILLDAPDTTSQRQPIQLSVRNQRVFLHSRLRRATRQHIHEPSSAQRLRWASP